MRTVLPFRVTDLLRSIAAFSLFAGALSASAAGAGPLRDEKGQDRAELARESSRRAAQESDALRLRERERRAFRTSLRLEQFEGACVAYHPGLDTCLVTVARFNRAVEGWAYPPGIIPDSASPEERIRASRRITLQGLLETFRLRDRVARAGVGDSLDRLWRAGREERLSAARKRAGDSALLARYRSLYAEMFARREERIAQLLATSDSVAAESLYRTASVAASAPPAGASGALNVPNAPNGPGPRRDVLPWQSLARRELPPRAAAAADSLARGAVSRPIRVPYGFLIVRWVSLREFPEIPFEEAVPALLAYPQDNAAMRAADERQVSDYYASHQGDFRSPDTACFRAWLDPRPARKASAVDTSRSPQAVGFWDLPRSVRAKLGLFLPCRPGTLVGPFGSGFGTWYFEAQGIRRGGTPLSLAQAKPIIARNIHGNRDESNDGETGPSDRAFRAAKNRDQIIWNALAYQVLPENPNEKSDWETWLRQHLDVRFVDLGADPVSSSRP
ncbi:MAG TPA: peptidylprolyl isomerase [Fibrobacteria bacterium]|nr:peptidylprolyl isomerase [Fibrobacteria bacterium]